MADADALQDYWLRWLLPVGTAVLVGTGSVAFTVWLLPEAAPPSPSDCSPQGSAFRW